MTIRLGDGRTNVVHERERSHFACGSGFAASQFRLFVSGRDQGQRGEMNIAIDVIDGLNRVVEEVEQECQSDSGYE